MDKKLYDELTKLGTIKTDADTKLATPYNIDVAASSYNEGAPSNS